MIHFKVRAANRNHNECTILQCLNFLPLFDFTSYKPHFVTILRYSQHHMGTQIWTTRQRWGESLSWNVEQHLLMCFSKYSSCHISLASQVKLVSWMIMKSDNMQWLYLGCRTIIWAANRQMSMVAMIWEYTGSCSAVKKHNWLLCSKKFMCDSSRCARDLKSCNKLIVK